MNSVKNANCDTPISRSMARKKSKLLKTKSVSPGEDTYIEAIRVVQCWRNQCVPATQNCFQIVMQCAQIIDGAVATFRMKRVKSIVNKIQRPNSNFELSTLDDVGGCRLIVSTIDDVEIAKKFLTDHLTSIHILRMKDYINEPKESGYRSCHILTQQEIDGVKYRIEIQIRTKLQHYWATAIEVVDELYGESIKSPNFINSIEKENLRELKNSLAIVSSLFALEEHTTIIPGASSTKKELLTQLSSSDIFRSLIDDMEEACSDVLELITGNAESSEIFILSFTKEDQFLLVQPFTSEQLENALAKYAKLEQTIESNEHTTDNVVLVHAKGVEQLRLAYPNYSANTPEYVRKVREYFVLAQ
ncbi:RelA/SpoT domain-containing protein [Arcanobacterium buesumense]|uniref:RelA/SpoT domain-containing protein n=1 Tax=Arcanobacterium buesumense TaxID=2722751 RepID=A0A6H2EMT6_9ACTO|nr:RelA/SpoT domain-containing protein [Arcanobacterium buesumense]QJC22381.1 RelA/SpoT domain-containing protein [Arcanobacterium buesumense]